MKALKFSISDYEHEREHYKWYLLIIALLINLLILFLLFIITVDHDFFTPAQREYDAPVVFEQPPPAVPQPPAPPEPKKTDEVAALKPGGSQFGMPDEFQEEELNMAQNALEEIEQYEMHEEEIVEQQIKEEVKQEQPPEPNPAAASKALQQAYNNPESLVKKQEQKTDNNVEKTDEQPVQKSIKPQQEPHKPEIIKAPIKKELSFQEMAKGFLASLDEGGHDLMERKGNENIRPDFEEMRVLCYLQKIIWFMQQEWMRSDDLRTTYVPSMVVTGVSITVDKSGELKHASVVQSSGNNVLDSAILKGIKDASPYPSLPAHFKEKDFTAQFGIKHCGQAPQSSRPHFRMR